MKSRENGQTINTCHTANPSLAPPQTVALAPSEGQFRHTFAVFLAVKNLRGERKKGMEGDKRKKRCRVHSFARDRHASQRFIQVLLVLYQTFVMVNSS